MTEDRADIFRHEAEELFEQLETALLGLEAAPGDSELVANAFRALHTIKGSGSVFGFDALAKFTHQVESLFDGIRKGLVAPDRALIGAALAAKDHMRQLLDAPDTVSPEAEGAILAALGQAAPGGGLAAPTAAAAPSGESGARVRFVLPPDAFRQGTDPLLLIEDILALGPGSVVADLSALPPLEAMDPETCYLAWEVLLAASHAPLDIENIFLFVRDETELTITSWSPGANDPESKPPAEAGPAGRAEPVIKVGASRVDALMDLVGELVTAQSRLRRLTSRNGESELGLVAEEIERISAALRETTMSIRMVPVSSLFNRFRRIVRDLSLELGKDIRLVIRGAETELDKTVIESLLDPLIHMVRNAADHGLETAADRVFTGKPAHGTITLAAEHMGSQVVIAVEDDGRGIDRAKVRAKAEELGLIAASAEIADAELLEVLFHPGFSTAKAVTNVSGRGIGMDVLRKAIDAMRGSIDIASKPGQGSRLSLRLPLTLAIIDGLLIRVGDQRYVVPLATVEECVALNLADGEDYHHFLSLRDELVAYVRLRDLFEETAAPSPKEMVVIVTVSGQRVGLVVDQLLGDHQVVIKSLSPLYRDVRYFSGATILGDGRVALILDVLNLLAAAQMREERNHSQGDSFYVD